MNNLGLLNYFLVLEVRQHIEEIFISQKKYIDNVPENVLG